MLKKVLRQLNVKNWVKIPFSLFPEKIYKKNYLYLLVGSGRDDENYDLQIATCNKILCPT
jgi:hypothetical protein